MKRLYEAIENGVINASDPSLKDRIAELSAIRNQAQADAGRATAALERLGPAITPERRLRANGMASASRFRRGNCLPGLYMPEQIDGRSIDNVVAWSRASLHS